MTLRDRLDALEKELIGDALKESKGNRTEAARLLGMEVRTLRNKIHKYGFPPIVKSQKLFLDETRLRSMYESGCTLQEIATFFDCSTCAIHTRVLKAYEGRYKEAQEKHRDAKNRRKWEARRA